MFTTHFEAVSNGCFASFSFRILAYASALRQDGQSSAVTDQKFFLHSLQGLKEGLFILKPLSVSTSDLFVSVFLNNDVFGLQV